MPYCRKCGSKQCDDFVFCTECGVKRVDPNVVPEAVSAGEALLSDEEKTLRGESAENKKAEPDAPDRKPLLTVDYTPAVTVTAPSDSASAGMGFGARKAMCGILVCATVLIQFLPFYRADTLFYDFEASSFRVIMEMLEYFPSKAEGEVTALLLLSIFSVIVLVSAAIYFFASDGVGLLTGSLVFSGLTQAYIPLGMPFSSVRINPNNEELLTAFFYIYYVLLIASIFALLWHNSKSKEEYYKENKTKA